MNTSTAWYFYDAAFVPDLKRVALAPGALGINGYLTGRYATTTTAPEAAHALGLGWLPTYEEAPDELVGASRATGRAVGDKILAALKARKVPLDGTVAVYPSVDVNVPAARADLCNEAWRGLQDRLHGKVSVRAYAEGAVIDALAKAGLVDGRCWLAAPSSWPGFNVDSAHVCMVQLVGTDVPGTDRNHFVTDPHALGAWWPDVSPFSKTPNTTLWEQIMTLDRNSADYKAFLADVARAVATSDDWRSGRDGYKTGYTLDTVIREAIGDHVDGKLGALASVLNALPERVAQLQAATASLQASVAELGTRPQAVVDAAALAQAVTADVTAAVKQLQLVVAVNGR